MALSQADTPADKAPHCRPLWATATLRGNKRSSGFYWIPPSPRAPQPQLHPPGQAWPMGRFIRYGKKVGQASHRCFLGWTRHNLALPAPRWQPRVQPGMDNASRLLICHFQLQALPAANSPCPLDCTSFVLHPKGSQGHICWVPSSKAACFVSDKPGGADKRESVSVITTNAAH